MMSILQVFFDWNEFVKIMLGTYDLAMVLGGLLFALAGALLGATGTVYITKQNRTDTPDPDPSALKFVFTDRKGRFMGGLIVVLIVLRIFAPQFTNFTLLALFASGVGLLNYLLTDTLINLFAKAVNKFLPGFRHNIPEENTKP